MPMFTYYLHERSDAVPSFEIELFDDVDPAVAHGEQLLKERPRYKFVEITREERPVARLTRADADPGAASGGD